MYGKIKRMNRLFDKESNHTLLIPMDHGATVGPIDGIEKISNTIQQYKENLVNGIILCKGQLNNIEIISKVSAKYCYAIHELRLHQNDRCKRFTLV